MTEPLMMIRGNLINGERAYIGNINENDIISYKVKGNWIYSVVIGTTPTMIKVYDLKLENTEEGIKLYRREDKNEITKCLIKPSRKIFHVKISL